MKACATQVAEVPLRGMPENCRQTRFAFDVTGSFERE